MIEHLYSLMPEASHVCRKGTAKRYSTPDGVVPPGHPPIFYKHTNPLGLMNEIELKDDSLFESI
ncbi:hypothetical protein, partial [Sunxiuqinia dokdonensis]|uniref:hypothetical protein n=1 Tax=Sunxiuqinia dokdonensis TaxID=1409788 RepID=UPI0019559C23